MDNSILWFKKKNHVFRFNYSENKIIIVKMALLKIRHILTMWCPAPKWGLVLRQEWKLWIFFILFFLIKICFNFLETAEQLLMFCLKNIKCSNI